MSDKALLIGNSDGIGLALTTELLNQRWHVIGMSRSESPVKNSSYEHIVVKVQDDKCLAKLKLILKSYQDISIIKLAQFLKLIS